MKRKSVFAVLFAVVLVFSMTACTSLGQVSQELGNVKNQVEQQVATVVPKVVEQIPQKIVIEGDTGGLLAAYQGTLENIYTAVNPSVVNIRVVSKVDTTSFNMPEIPGFPFFNMPGGNGSENGPEQYQSGLGSGFVWDKEGHIVTNNHVIDGADKIEVTFSDGSIVPAELVGADPDSDLAVIKVDVDAAKLQPVKMSAADGVKVGQLAIAIGNPYGLEGSMTAGIVSAVGRSLPVDQTSQQSYTIPEIIQTDAPINPGNSGGVLLDANSEVIGVTAAIESASGANAGIGFAIPATIVNKVVPVLIKDGSYAQSWIGISGTSLVPELATAMNLDAGQRGALIAEVFPQSPAEKAGLKGSSKEVTIDGQTVTVGGDVITAINGQPVRDMSDLIAYLATDTEVGQNVQLSILRDGKEQTVEVTLEARPSSNEEGTAQSPSGKRGVTLGIAGITVNSSIASEMSIPENTQGVLVEEVQSGSLADTAGLRAGDKTAVIDGNNVTIGGDIITALNGQPVASIEELKAGLGQLTTDQELSLTLLRGGKEMEITIQP